MPFTDLIPYINLAGFVVLVVVTFYNNYKSGKNTVTKEVLDLYEKQIQALKAENELSRTRSHDLANQIQTLSLKTGHLEGQLKEKDQKLTEYMTIFQNRNPELTEFIANISKFAEGSQQYMEQTGIVIKEIHGFMKQISQNGNSHKSKKGGDSDGA